MIQSVGAIDCPPFYDRHGPEVLLLTGFIGELSIAPGDLDIVVSQELLEALQTHPCIEKLTGKGVSQTVYGIALMDQSSPPEILVEQVTRTGIAEGISSPGVEEKLFMTIPLFYPRLQCIPGIIAKVNNSTPAGLCPFADGDFSFSDIDITSPES